MSRDFIGALLQLNAEKNISREALIRTVEEAISRPTAASPGNENVCVEVDSETGRRSVSPGHDRGRGGRGPAPEFSLEEARAVKPDAQLGER